MTALRAQLNASADRLDHAAADLRIAVRTGATPTQTGEAMAT